MAEQNVGPKISDKEHPLYFIYEKANLDRKKILCINPKLIWHYYFFDFITNVLPTLQFMTDFNENVEILFFGSFATVLAIETYANIDGTSQYIEKFIENVDDLDIVLKGKSEYQHLFTHVARMFKTKILSLMNFHLDGKLKLQAVMLKNSVEMNRQFRLSRLRINDTFEIDIVNTCNNNYMKYLAEFINGNPLRRIVFTNNGEFTFIKNYPGDNLHLANVIKNHRWLVKKNITGNIVDKPSQRYLCNIKNAIDNLATNNSVEISSKISFFLGQKYLKNIKNVSSKNIPERKGIKVFYNSLKDLNPDDCLNCSICMSELLRNTKKIEEEYADFKGDLNEYVSMVDDTKFSFTQCCGCLTCADCAVMLIINENPKFFPNDVEGDKYQSEYSAIRRGLKQSCPKCRKNLVHKVNSIFLMQ